MRRAERLKADPDLILNLGLVCLVCGVGGARLFYVLHYWESSFAKQANPLFAALNCTSGGLEYYGGLIGAIVGCVVYIIIKRASLRMYLDILTPAAAWGLAFGRMGCLLNGCCWGGLCVDAHNHATIPWGISFPHHSPAQIRQWENRQLTLPAELIVTDQRVMLPRLLPGEALDLSPEERARLTERTAAARTELETRKRAGASSKDIAAAEAELRKALAREESRGLLTLERMRRLPSRVAESANEPMTLSELEELTHRYRSRLVHPAQVYGIINALLLSWFLLTLLYRRKRHGVVFAALCAVYPITRIILEIIRVDNPHDSAGLTISQAVSVGMCLFGVALIFYLRRLPERSPLAVPFVPPPEDARD
jgi:phosphatidylglycerol:prolipoprotein diacylglycerol transferase